MQRKFISVLGDTDNFYVRIVNCSIIWLASYWIGAIIITVRFLEGDKFCKIGSK